MTIVRTGYSFRSAAGHLSEVVSRVKEIGSSVLAVADTCSTYAFVKLTKEAEKVGLRMVYGVELMCCPELGAKRQGQDRWIFLARDDLRSIHDLIGMATENPGSEPFLTYAQALKAKGVIKVMGEAARVNLEEDLIERSHLSDNDLSDFFNEGCLRPQEDLFLGLSPATPRGQIKAAREAGHPFLAYPNNRYPRREDLEFYRVTLGRSAGSQTYPMHILSNDEWEWSMQWLPAMDRREALINRDLILHECRAKLKRASLLVPDKPKDLRQLCLEGAEKLGCDLSRPEYAARLNRELAMIREKEFDDYFHIVADIMAFARNNMVVGPARGSSCGSLVCYLLGITSIDPIPFDLVFERFIDVTRKDLPDIDVDLSEKNRHLVFEYVSNTYGRDRSARLGSVNMLKAKAAMNQVGTSLRIPKFLTNEVTNTIIKRSIGDARAMATIEEALHETEAGRRILKEHPEIDIVTRMEGHPAAAAQHAAGIILTDTSVKDYVAVNHRTGGTMCDKRDAEDLNLLKIDALGLLQLTIFERCLELMGKPQRNEFLEKIPLDDQTALDVMNDKKFSGIFQFIPGAATVDLVELVLSQGGRLNKLDDLVALTAIVRPGPLNSGQAEEWIRRRVGKNQVSYAHPSLEPYLKSTYGLVLYQEQVLAIGREMGDLTWEDVTALRKAMSKSLGKEYFSQFAERWIEGAIRKVGMPREIGIKFFDELCNFGSWAFNLSHSVAYGVVSYWCCWLKSHYPLEFCAATLDSHKDPFKQIDMLRELRQEGVSYVPVDADKSTTQWEMDKEKRILVGPLTNVIGIGPKKVQLVMDSRENGSKLKPALRKLLDHAKTPIDSLDPIRDAIQARDLKKLKITSIPKPVKDVVQSGRQEVCIFGLVSRLSTIDLNEPDKVAKRGYEIKSGPTKVIRFWIRDDTDEIFCRINQWKTQKWGVSFIQRARVKKSLFAVKGSTPADFPMINVEAVRYIGEIDHDPEELAAAVNGTDREADSRGLHRRKEGPELEGEPR